MTLPLLLALLAAGPEVPISNVTLDDEPAQVRFVDGDSFEVVDGRHKGADARLQGFNSLESYGPVHRWGEWKPADLAAIAAAATTAARKGGWHCKSEGEKDRYSRILVQCDDMAKALLAEGLAHLYSVEGPAPEALQAAQRQAQSAKKGMWQKGTPEFILSSVHSADEEKEPYNRVVSTKDGHTEKHEHQNHYETCKEVCDGGSCLLFVPFKNRYGDARAACLK